MAIILYAIGEREGFLLRNKNRIPKEDLTQIQESKQHKQTNENSKSRQ